MGSLLGLSAQTCVAVILLGSPGLWWGTPCTQAAYLSDPGAASWDPLTKKKLGLLLTWNHTDHQRSPCQATLILHQACTGPSLWKTLLVFSSHRSYCPSARGLKGAALTCQSQWETQPEAHGHKEQVTSQLLALGDHIPS